MKRPLAWLAAAGILVAAGAVVALAPQEQWAQGPIPVAVGLGEEGTGRNIQATIHSVAVAESLEVTGEDWAGDTEGVWVVVEVTAQNRVNPAGIQSSLLIGDLEFRGTDRLDYSGLEQWVLVPGLPTSGPVAFEIPRDLAGERAVVMLGLGSDSRLDSVITTTVELGELPVLPTLAVAPAGRTER